MPIIVGGLFPGSISDRVAAAYDRHLFGGATLQDLPNAPRFVINATNVQSGALWRFEKPYMRDYRVGEVKAPTIPLARAVAASSAFPPVLSPCELRLENDDFTPGSGTDLQRAPFTTRVLLTDGGVYDNLGLETAWKRYQTVFVSDAGGKLKSEEEPKSDWARHAYRVLDLVDNQVRSLRKRQVINSFKAGTRKGAYWGVRTDIADYQLADALPCPFERTLALGGNSDPAQAPGRCRAGAADQLGLRRVRRCAAPTRRPCAAQTRWLSLSGGEGVSEGRCAAYPTLERGTECRILASPVIACRMHEH